MRRRTLTDDELVTLASGARLVNLASTDWYPAVLRAVYDAGRADPYPSKREQEARNKEHAHSAAPFLCNRFGWLFNTVSARHRTTPERMLLREGHSYGIETAALWELCWILHEVHHIGYLKIGAMVQRDHSSVISAVRKMNERLSSNAELRDELIAVGAEPEAKRSAA